jgi:hypothetical protein
VITSVHDPGPSHGASCEDETVDIVAGPSREGHCETETVEIVVGPSHDAGSDIESDSYSSSLPSMSDDSDVSSDEETDHVNGDEETNHKGDRSNAPDKNKGVNKMERRPTWTSSIHLALESKSALLLSFFKQCTLEEYYRSLALESEAAKSQGTWERLQNHTKAVAEKKAIQKREKAWLHKQREHGLKWEREVLQGGWSPGGTKCRMKQLNLHEQNSPKKKQRMIAEDMHPGRQLKQQWVSTKRKLQGCKRKAVIRDAKYHNWFTPFSWAVIKQATHDVGWEMSPTAIVQRAKAQVPTLFEGLTRETVRDWIDRSGERLRWSDAVLRRVKAGSNPGHSKGGQRGVLVSRLAVAT